MGFVGFGGVNERGGVKVAVMVGDEVADGGAHGASLVESHRDAKGIKENEEARTEK
jgi:hypothetical protein